MKKGRKLKIRNAESIEFEELLTFNNNSKEILEAYKNGNLSAVIFIPEKNKILVCNNPPPECLLKDSAVGFFIRQ